MWGVAKISFGNTTSPRVVARGGGMGDKWATFSMTDGSCDQHGSDQHDCDRRDIFFLTSFENISIINNAFNFTFRSFWYLNDLDYWPKTNQIIHIYILLKGHDRRNRKL